MKSTLLVLALAGGTTVFAAPPQDQSPGVPLRIEVVTPAGSSPAGPPRGALELVAVGGKGELEPLALALDGSGSYGTSVAPGSMWRVRTSAEGYWGADAVGIAGGPAAVIALHPTGELRGGLAVPPNVTPPDELHVTFRPSVTSGGRGLGQPAGRLRCPVEELGWRCSLPAGVHDLRLHAPGFASALAWDVTVDAGETGAGVAVSLVPGAAVLGRVEIDGEGRPEEVEVELRPAGGATRDPGSGGRLRQLERTTQPDRRGVFQLTDLAPGLYRIEARHGGRAPAVREPVEVLEGRELDLATPLVLAPPSELVLLIDPPVPPAEPGGWEVDLRALDGSNQSRTVVADVTGVAQLELAPGWYRLTVRDRRSTWVGEEIDLSPGRTVRDVELSLVAIEGTVRRGERGQRALLGFGRQSPREEEVRILTDREGSFSGHLPDEGEWPLYVQVEPGGSEVRLDPVDVVERPGEDVVRLDIELPDTQVVGRVVDAAGDPVPRALVLVWEEGSQAGRSKATSDELGGFRFWGLSPGEWVVEAFSMPRSGRSSIDLEEGERKQIEVRLSDERVVEGRVVSDWGPVAGAFVYAVPEVSRTTPLVPWRTDPLGGFEARVPADATAIHLFVLAFGRPATLLRVPLPPGGEVRPEIELPWAEAAGTLRLDLPPLESGLVELRRGSARVPISLLREWSSMQGTRLPLGGHWAVGGMEAGPWEICQHGECDSGILVPAGELELSLVPRE